MTQKELIVDPLKWTVFGKLFSVTPDKGKEEQQ